ncbi:unnamed protein product, partial [marine sediment metagenome]
ASFPSELYAQYRANDSGEDCATGKVNVKGLHG